MRLPVSEPTEIGEARRQVAKLTGSMAFTEEAAARAAVVVTEMAGNLAKYAADGGEILVHRLMSDGVSRGIELLALDRGPGIADISQALRDGYSTSGSPGTGLGALGRLADLFQIHSLPGVGTALLAKVWAQPGAGSDGASVASGGVCVAKSGQTVSGDGWARRDDDDGTTLLVVDGLGHGMGAADAAGQALRIFKGGPLSEPAMLLNEMHGALRSTRGAAAAVARLDARQGCIKFAGIGNISGSIITSEGSRSMVSHNGIVGHEMRRIQEFTYPWTGESVLVLHSDGIRTRWDLQTCAGLLGRHPSLVAGVLFRDFERGTDDATVLVAQRKAPASPDPNTE